ncbi:MAG: sec-independent protein translocase protein TatA [Candidatus Krumholzibacteriia bacterium]|jgi:sec-independent protein translocase protein TatA
MMPIIAFLTGLGWPEILLILALVLVLFGPKRLPEIAEAMGKSIRKFKSATSDATRDVKNELDDVNREMRDEKPAAKPSSHVPKDSGDDKKKG